MIGDHSSQAISFRSYGVSALGFDPIGHILRQTRNPSLLGSKHSCHRGMQQIVLIEKKSLEAKYFSTSTTNDNNNNNYYHLFAIHFSLIGQKINKGQKNVKMRFRSHECWRFVVLCGGRDRRTRRRIKILNGRPTTLTHADRRKPSRDAALTKALTKLYFSNCIYHKLA